MPSYRRWTTADGSANLRDMPDQVAAQNLYDALRSFVGSGPTRGWYDWAKDFQPIVAGVLAIIVAARGSYLAYKGVMKRIDFDRDNRTQERNSAVRARKYGAFFRLRSEMRRLKQVASEKKTKIDSALKTARGEADETGRMRDLETEWQAAFSFEEFDEFKELDKAWKKIDAFPLAAIRPIDSLRSRLILIRSDMAHCLAERKKDGNVAMTRASICRDHCEYIENEADLLAGVLDQPIDELARIEWPKRNADKKRGFLRAWRRRPPPPM
jgi:hypothetical protein